MPVMPAVRHRPCSALDGACGKVADATDAPCDHHAFKITAIPGPSSDLVFAANHP